MRIETSHLQDGHDLSDRHATRICPLRNAATRFYFGNNGLLGVNRHNMLFYFYYIILWLDVPFSTM
jgi:hypothetical protein